MSHFPPPLPPPPLLINPWELARTCASGVSLLAPPVAGVPPLIQPSPFFVPPSAVPYLSRPGMPSPFFVPPTFSLGMMSESSFKGNQKPEKKIAKSRAAYKSSLSEPSRKKTSTLKSSSRDSSETTAFSWLSYSSSSLNPAIDAPSKERKKDRGLGSTESPVVELEGPPDDADASPDSPELNSSASLAYKRKRISEMSEVQRQVTREGNRLSAQRHRAKMNNKWQTIQKLFDELSKTNYELKLQVSLYSKQKADLIDVLRGSFDEDDNEN